MTDLVALGKLGEIVSGSTPNTNQGNYWNGDIPWITPADLTRNEEAVFRGPLRKITAAGFQSCSTKMLPKGSIIFSSRAPIGHCAVTAFPLCTNQGFKSIIPNHRLDALYGYYALRFFTPALVSQGRGATFAEINKEIFEDFRIPVPAIEEQCRLAALLDKADHLRRTRRYAQQLSDTFLQSVFLEMFGDYLALTTTTKLNDVLEMPLSNGLFENNINYGSGNPVIWVDNLYHTVEIDVTQLRRARLSAETIKKYAVAEGDLLFTRSSLVKEGIGQVNIVPVLPELTTYECHTIRARVNRKLVNPYYVLGLYRSDYGRRLIMGRANTATMTTIGQEGIGELLCPLPPLPLQTQFAQIVRRTERLRAQQREAARQADHLFQALLHRAFRGEV